MNNQDDMIQLCESLETQKMYCPYQNGEDLDVALREVQCYLKAGPHGDIPINFILKLHKRYHGYITNITWAPDITYIKNHISHLLDTFDDLAYFEILLYAHYIDILLWNIIHDDIIGKSSDCLF